MNALNERPWGVTCPDCYWTTRDEGYDTRRETMHAYRQHRDRDHRKRRGMRNWRCWLGHLWTNTDPMAGMMFCLRCGHGKKRR
jgi:hypothetical protein